MPEQPGIIRLGVLTSAFICKAINGGQGTQFSFICEMDFKAKIPKGLVARGGAQAFSESIKKMKKILGKQKKTNSLVEIDFKEFEQYD